MTKKLSETFNMKSLEELMAEVDADETEHDSAEENLPAVVPADNMSGSELMTTKDMRGDDHADAMDDIYDKAMEVADKIVDLGFNMDPARAPRVLEVANQWLKTAADVKISKRDSQLKLMKLVIEQRKLALEERAAGLASGEVKGDVVFEGDRNALLKMIAAKRDAQEDDETE